jgi:two-component system, NarL family, nitrate/nitrite response regulator NarL
MDDPVLYSPQPKQKMPEIPLSRREMQMALLICDGHCNKTAAAELGVSPRTVETFRMHLRMKLDITSTAGIVRWAIRNKLIEP